MTSPSYALLIPVKDSRSAKTRLGVDGEGQRARLMEAFARDSIAAARGCPLVRVFVVGDTAFLGDVAAGVQALPDEGDGDLNRALTRAADRLRAEGHADALGIAVMLADLPCLRTDDLNAALERAVGRSHVPDAAGTGTTLLVAPAGTELDPRFGSGSSQAHAASGAVPIGDDLASLRLDVDTTDDLQAALAFGVGASTAALVA
ncbi:MAG TPA: 2-phospho-L-lactate guanylyltransferase [Marmoricola sp.]|nr:2-phospho-L-lactate guanylyltransferase [Marmoricola sp.]